jgi:hypothetical protein
MTYQQCPNRNKSMSCCCSGWRFVVLGIGTPRLQLQRLLLVLLVVVAILTSHVASFSLPDHHRHYHKYDRIQNSHGRKWGTTSGLKMAPQQLDKGFNLLELASKVVPQGRIVETAKESWKFVWKVTFQKKSGKTAVHASIWGCVHTAGQSLTLLHPSLSILVPLCFYTWL